MTRDFDTFVGIDLGGARGKTTAVARLELRPDCPSCIDVHEVSMRRRTAVPWYDDHLLEYLSAMGEGTVVAVNAPLTVPACLRCRLDSCPGQEACVDPAVVWLRDSGARMEHAAVLEDRDRIAAIPATGDQRSSSTGTAAGERATRLEPYIHRCTEVALHYDRGVIPRDCIGLGTGPIAARGAHLRKRLETIGFVLNRNLLEVTPRATIYALFGAAKARGYKRDADPWETRASIVEGLADMGFSPRSRLSREQVLRNDHCFEALLSGYTGYLWQRDDWQMPAKDHSVLHTDGFIWTPPSCTN